MDELDQLDQLDQLEEPKPSPPQASGAPAEAPAPRPPRAPRAPRAKGHRTLLTVIAVLVVVGVIIGVYIYVVGLPQPATSTTPVVPNNCLGDTSGDWPTYLGEISRNAQNCGEKQLSSSNAAQLTQLWAFNTSEMNPGYLDAEPIVVDNTVYVGAGNGIFYAINATSGKEVWQSINLGNDTQCYYPDGITSSATVTGGEVYVGGGDGTFYVLNQSTGHVDWSYFVGNVTQGYYIWASPLVLTNLHSVYFGIASNSCDTPLVNGGLLQLSLTTHQKVNFFSDLSPAQQSACNPALPHSNSTNSPGCGGSIWSSPAYDAATNTIWATTGNGYGLSVPEYGDSLMEWNASTLALISHWTVPNADQIYDGDFGGTPTLVDPVGGPPMVFATSKNGWSYAFDRDNIAAGPVWQYLISQFPSVAPDAYGGGYIYVAGHGTTIGGTHYSGAIRAFNPQVNQTVWAVGMPDEVTGAPIYANGLVVVASSTVPPIRGGLLDVLNSTTGKVLFSYTGTGQYGFEAAASIANGVIYIGNTNGLLLAFGLPGGGGAVEPATASGPAGHSASPNVPVSLPIWGGAVGLLGAYPVIQAVPRE